MVSVVPDQAMLQEIDVLWITAGLGCDGDTIAMTAATQPSIEDLVQGALPGVPRVRLHNPVLAYDVGDAFMRRFERAAAGQSDPFILVVEGSIPNEALKTEGYWAAFGMDPHTGQPIPTCTWIDRLAPQAWARAIHALRKYTQTSLDVEPAWRQPGPALTTGHHPTTC